MRKIIYLLTICAVVRVGLSNDEGTTTQTESTGEEITEAKTFSENEALESLLIIEGMGGAAGTGFITEINDRIFAVTNLHVISAFGDPKNPNVSIRTAQNVKLEVERVFGAKDHDIALIQFDKSESYRDRALTFKGSIEKFVQTDDELKIPGNSKGRGVFLWTPGKIRGIGTNKIEHDAPTFRGNSGSPVIHVSSNSVVGVDTETTFDPIEDPFDKDARGNKDSAIKDDFRYFAYRLDTPDSWYEIDLREFQNQAERLEKWKEERLLAISFIQSFLGYDPDYKWWDENRLRSIATKFVEDAQAVSSGREKFTGTDGIYDYYSIYQVIHPAERSRLRRRVIGQLHNYIDFSDKREVLEKGRIYPFLVDKYRHEIAWSEWLTEYLEDNRKFLSE